MPLLTRSNLLRLSDPSSPRRYLRQRNRRSSCHQRWCHRLSTRWGCSRLWRLPFIETASCASSSTVFGIATVCLTPSQQFGLRECALAGRRWGGGRAFVGMVDPVSFATPVGGRRVHATKWILQREYHALTSPHVLRTCLHHVCAVRCAFTFHVKARVSGCCTTHM